MKKMLVVMMFVFAAANVFAVEWGVGYEKGGISTRLWVNEWYGVDLGFRMSDENVNGLDGARMIRYYFSFSPLIVCYFKNQYGNVSSGVNFTDVLTSVNTKYKNNYELYNRRYILAFDILKFEIAIPGFENLFVCGDTGVYFEWEQKKYSKIGLNNAAVEKLGLIYYFELKR